MNRLQSIVEILWSHWNRILVIGAIAVLSVAAIALLYLGHTDAISGGEATAIATVLLVALTGVYATVTYLMMLETRKSREQDIRPVFNFQAEEYGSTLINVGSGPARKLDVTLSLLPAGEMYPIQRQSVPAGGALAIPVEPFSSIGDREFLGLQLQD